MSAPVSACLIVRDDPHLPKTLACLTPHVAEIVVVYTGQGAKEFEVWRDAVRGEGFVSTVFDHFTHASRPDGTLFDFAAARNRSFALATQPWILWADSDDLLEGLEHLPDVIANFERAISRALLTAKVPRLCCRYEYVYDKDGRCTRLVVRERIVPNVEGIWHWVRPVHEQLETLRAEEQLDLYEPRLVWKHQGALPGRSSCERNLKILQDYALKLGPRIDPLTLFDLGREYAMSPDGVPEAIECFTKYLQIAKVPQERAAACLHLSELWWRREAPRLKKETVLNTLLFAQQATQECGRFEDWFAYAKVQWIEAIVRQKPAMFELARRAAKRALAAPTAGTYDSCPRDREIDVHELIADCKEQTKETIGIEYGGLGVTVTRRRKDLEIR